MDLDIAIIKNYAMTHFRCEGYSVHGLDHWERVLRNGTVISRRSGADIIVVTLFAYLHDSCRWDDGSDLEHGRRAAKLAVNMQGEYFTLTQEQLQMLAEACRDHTSGKCSANPTIGTCWDADRLDLGRVGNIPDPLYMSTEPGKDIAKLGSLALYVDK